MFGHHGSKAAANMVGHLLGYDLKARGIPIAMIHVSPRAIEGSIADPQPGFLKTGTSIDPLIVRC